MRHRVWFAWCLFFVAVAVETLALSASIANAFTVPKVVAVLLGAAVLSPVVILSYKRIPWIFLLQFIVICVCTIFSLNPQISFWGADWRRMGLITWAAILVIAASLPILIHSNKSRWLQFLRFTAMIGAIAAGYGILQWFNADPFLPQGLREKLIQEFGGVYRAIGTIGQPTQFANYLLYPLFCAIALLRLETNRWWRRFSTLGAVAIVLALMLTMSRGAILGLAAGILLLACAGIERRRIAVAVAIIGLALAGSGFLLLRTSHYGKQLQTRLDYVWNDTTGSGRLILWEDVTLRLLPKFWLQGTGLGMFRPAFAQVRSDRYAMSNPDVHWETAHNILLDRWSEQGIAGLLMFVLVIMVTVANMRLALRNARDARERWALMSVLAAFIAALVGNIFNGETIPTTFYFYLWAALSFATKECFGDTRNNWNAMPVAGFRRYAMVGAAALSCVFVWHANNNWQAEKHLAQAAKAADDGNVARLLDAGRASVSAFPEQSVYSLEFSDLIRRSVTMRALSDSQRRRLIQVGIEYALKATEGDKAMLAYYNLANLGSLADDPRTEMWLEHLISIDPYWHRPHQLLASQSLRHGELERAEKEAQIAHTLAPFDSASTSLSLQIGTLRKESAPLSKKAEEHQKWINAYGHLPLTFEANRGQVDSQVDFLAKTHGYTIFTTPGEAVLVMRSATASKPDVVRMTLASANTTAIVTGMEEQPGRANYFIGTDSANWHQNIPTFGKVKYRAIYPGVDLIYYGNQQQLEYDFAIAPGATPETIALQFQGDVESVSEDSSGNLNVLTPSGTIQLQRPRSYQEVPDGQREVSSKYVVEKRSVHFKVGPYDRTRPLIIDPVLVYSTYLGGSMDEAGYGIAVDASGNAYIAGQSNSIDFPGSGGSTVANAFLAKLNPSGSALLYSAFFGGDSDSVANGVGLDASGNAYIAGKTGATNFPVTADAFQHSSGGGGDAFVTKIALPSGTLAYSSYIGGSSGEFGLGLAVDASGNAVIVGNTASINFPTVNAVQPSLNGSLDAFVTKLNPDGTVLYSTYWGGEAQDEADGVALDASGDVVLVGQTGSTSFPLVNAVQSTTGGLFDAFVTKLNPTGSAVIYSTYLGGSGWEFGSGVAIDTSGNAYVTGLTTSTNFPKVNPQATAGGCFVTKISPDGGTLQYSTYFGSDQAGYGIAVDASGNAYVTGRTSSDFTPINAPQPVRGGNTDGFFLKLNPAGVFVLATYLGGSDSDGGYRIAVDASGSAYITGETHSTNFPTAGPLQPNKSGSSDAFVTKIGTASDLSITIDTVPSVAAGTPLTYTMTVRNGGPATATGVTLHGLVPIGTSFVSITSNQGSCTPPGPNQDYSCALGTIPAGSSVAVTLQLNVTALNGATISIQAWLTADSDDLYVANNAAQQFTIVTHAPMISMNRNWLYFNSPTVGVNPPNQTFELINTGTGTLNWTATPASSDGWLSVTPTSGNGNATLTVSVAAGLKPVGTYKGTITITATGALNSPVVLPVIFRVGQTVSGPYVISTAAGTNVITENSQANTQPTSPAGMAVDSFGNIYFSDPGRSKLFKISNSGLLTTLAGTGPGHLSAGDGGLATAAQLNNPLGVAVDSNGNVFFAESLGNRIRRIDGATGIVTTVAGNGNAGFSGDGGPATNAMLYYPSAVALDGRGNIYIADSLNHRIRKVAINGTITTIAGTGISGSSEYPDGSMATSVDLYLPGRMVADAAGNLYFADIRVRKINSTAGTISTVAGAANGSCPSSGDNGPAIAASLCGLVDLGFDATGNLYIGESLTVRKVNNEGIISTLPGTFSQISGIAVTASGNVFVGDSGYLRIQKINSADGMIQTVGGVGSPGFGGDNGPATSAEFNHPQGLATDFSGNLYIADKDNRRVRKVTPGGIVSTIAGTGGFGSTGDGGLATAAQFTSLLKIAADVQGNIYVTDYSKVRKMDVNGIITTIAGNGSTSFSGDGGPATSAGMFPFGLAVDAIGNVYIGDSSAHRVRKITPDGIINTIAGNGGSGSTGDGGPAIEAELQSVQSLSVDSVGNLYISEGVNPFSSNIMRRVAPDGTISTVALSGPVATDPVDRIIVGRLCAVAAVIDSTHHSTIAGTACGVSGDGGPALRAGINTGDLAVDPDGNIYVSDSGYHLVRKLTPVPDGSFTLTTSPSGLTFPTTDGLFGRNLGINLDGFGTGNWSLVKSASSNWLTVVGTSGTGSSSIDVTANTSGLQPGFYAAYITITSPEAINESVVVPVSLKVDYPSPTLASMIPSTIPIGSGMTIITLTGSDFANAAKAQIGDTILETTFVNSTQLTAVIPAGMLTSVGAYTITVFNPSPGGGIASLPFSVIDPNAKKRSGQITSQ